MTLSNGFETLVDSDTLEATAFITAGVLLSNHVMPGVVTQMRSVVGIDRTVPNELYGLLTALVFYGYGDRVLDSERAMMVGHGGVVAVMDSLAKRFDLPTTLESTVSG